MSFANPLWLIGLVFIPFYYFWLKKHQKNPRILFSNTAQLKGLNYKPIFKKTPSLIPIIILILLIIALARPVSISKIKDIESEGIHIMLALDVSGSMAAEDLTPNRLEAAKNTITDFINQRSQDHIGAIIFGTDAYTKCPLTLDYNLLSNLINQVKIGDAGAETAIGMALATALNRLKDSKAKSKIIILLTDGENNQGDISPSNAAQIAKSLNIKIYTIGVGKKGGAPIPYIDPVLGKQYYQDAFGRPVLTKLDEITLKKIAAETKGFYFRAENIKELNDIYNKINQLETSKIKTKTYTHTHEYFPVLLWFIFILCCLHILYLLFKTKVLP